MACSRVKFIYPVSKHFVCKFSYCTTCTDSSRQCAGPPPNFLPNQPTNAQPVKTLSAFVRLPRVPQRSPFWATQILLAASHHHIPTRQCAFFCSNQNCVNLSHQSHLPTFTTAFISRPHNLRFHNTRREFAEPQRTPTNCRTYVTVKESERNSSSEAKVKVSLSHHEDIRGSGGTAPIILNLGTR